MSNRQSKSSLNIIGNFLLTHSNYNKVKTMHISKGLISSYLKILLLLQLYDLQRIHMILIYPCNTYNRPCNFYRISSSSGSAAFDIFFFTFPFPPTRIPHLSIVFHDKFLTRDVFCYFISSFRSYIVSQFKPNCIRKALYFPKLYKNTDLVALPHHFECDLTQDMY